MKLPGEEKLINDSGWIDLTNYLTEAFSVRNDYTPQFRKINNLVFLRGQIYLNSNKNGIQIAFQSLPKEIRPSMQKSASGITYSDHVAYYMFISSNTGNLSIDATQYNQQGSAEGFDLSLFSPYLTT